MDLGLLCLSLYSTTNIILKYEENKKGYTIFKKLFAKIEQMEF